MKTSLKTLIAVGLLSVASMTAHAQAYKPDFSTKVVLAGGGTDPSKSVTITATAPTSASTTYSWPGDYPTAAGYVLTSSTTGGLSWTAPGSANLGGDLSGTEANATVAKINGKTLGTGTASPADASLLLFNSTNNAWEGHGMTGDISIDNSGLTAIGTGKVTSAMILDGTIANADVASNAAIAYSKLNLATSIVNGDIATNAAIAYSKLNLATSIVNGDIATNAAIDGSKINPSFGSQAVSTSGSISTTGSGAITSAGLLTASNGFTVSSGTITLPNTSIANSALQGSGALTVTAGAGLSGGGSVALGSSTTVSLDLSHANTWTGTQTLGGVAMTANAPSTYASTQNDLALSASNSYFRLQASANINITGIASGVDGRVIVITNVGTSGNSTNFNITLKNEDSGSTTAGDRFHFAGSSDIILAPDGVATLVYDGGLSRWRLVSAQ